MLDLKRLRLKEGDRWYLDATPQGDDFVIVYDPEFGRRIKSAEAGMARYRNTLRALAG